MAWGLVTAAATALACLPGASAGAASGQPVGSTVDSFTFTPQADTYVDSSQPASSFGTSKVMWVDASPTKHDYVQFQLTNMTNRTPVAAHLLLYQLNSSPHGGDVYTVSSNSWTESMTYDDAPPIDGPLLGSFGAVAANAWYQVDLDPSFVTGDGLVSLAMASADTDGAEWGTRQSNYPPQLTVDLQPVPGLVVDGLSTVTNSKFGSSDPTQYASNHRLAITSGGRLLTVFGRHAQGVQLAWRDPAAGWQSRTTGSVPDGMLLSGTGTGDWTASIAVAPDPLGAEHAWVVWAKASTSKTTSSLQLRRLSDLDAAGGPSVGPLVTVEGPGSGVIGAAKPDLAFESGPSGPRGCVVWTRRSGTATWDLATTWFTDLSTDTPTFEGTANILTGSTSAYRVGTLAPSAAGIRLVARSTSGKLQIFGHEAFDPLSSWWAGTKGPTLGMYAHPSGQALGSGAVVAAVESDQTNHVVIVDQFAGDGSSVSQLLQISGYKQPTVATDGSSVWLVMVRQGDGFIVSRKYDPGIGWGGDTVEVGPEGGGNHAWPNAMRDTDGRLRLVFRGPAGTTVQNAVLAFQRLL